MPSVEGTPHQLWGYILTNPPWPWNLVIHEDGTVEQREGMDQDYMNAALVIMWGGHQYEIVEGSWVHTQLVAAGYSFEEIT